MQLSSANRTRFEAEFNKLDATTANLLRGSGVAFNAGNFNASGVIFTLDNTRGFTYILTAKHNLLQGQPFEPGKTPAPSKLVDAFTAKAAVRYGAVNFSAKAPNSAPLDAAPNNGGNTKIFGGAAQDDWLYDVMMLKSADVGLLAQATQFALVKTQADLNALSLKLSTPGLVLKRLKQHTYIQAGFGYSADAVSDTDTYVGKFQVRYTDPTASAVADEVYGYDKDAGFDQINKNVARVNADDANSTAPGDSGGPLFLLDSAGKGPPDVFLLGVTLGSNQSLTKRTTVPDLPILTNSSNYLNVFICEAFPSAKGC